MRTRFAVPSRYALVAATAALALTGLGVAQATPLLPNLPSVTAGGAKVDIKGKIRLNGTGCPPGTTTANLARNTVFVSYSAFTVSTNKGQRVKSCTMDVPVRVPAGFSINDVSVTYRGTSENIGGGVIAKQQAKYFYAGSPITSKSPTSTLNPDGDFGDWQATDQFMLASINPVCDGYPTNVRVTSSILLRGNRTDGKTAFLSNDTTDMQLQRGLAIKFNLKKCSR